MDDQDRLQGVWRVVKQTLPVQGIGTPKDLSLHFTSFSFDGDKFLPEVNIFPGEFGEVIPYRYRLDEASAPKRIEWLASVDPFPDERGEPTYEWHVYHGIYLLEQDRLLLCFADGVGDYVPDKFATTDLCTTYVCERPTTRRKHRPRSS